MASKYATELEIASDACLKIIKKLQSTALENLKERDRFRATGQASLKVRVSSEGGGGRLFSVAIELGKKGLDLKEEISREIAIPVNK